MKTQERCSLCGCLLIRKAGVYAGSTTEGRSHATEHHLVPERFLGRSKNRPGEQRQSLFSCCPWQTERKTLTFCYECHEELLHNPVLLPDDVEKMAILVKRRGLDEDEKPADKDKIGGRIVLFHEVLAVGLKTLITEEVRNHGNVGNQRTPTRSGNAPCKN